MKSASHTDRRLHVLVHEFVTGGGWFSAADVFSLRQPPESLRCEGAAMRHALASDLAAVDGVRVTALVDARLTSSLRASYDVVAIDSAAAERQQLERMSAEADWVVLIAPEMHGWLLSRYDWAEAAGGRVLGPSRQLVKLATHKQHTANWLQARDVPMPAGQLIAAGAPLPRDFPYPAVIKPVDGVGSLDVQKLAGPLEAPLCDRDRRLERFVPGLAASVSFLCGPNTSLPLPACQQLLGEDGRFAYRGGRLPLPCELNVRAHELGRRVLAAVQAGMPVGTGYLGIDLILGEDLAGRDDFVIEINPRLTSSYLGLRQLSQQNLAGAMLDLAAGRQVALSFAAQRLQFAPDGCQEIARGIVNEVDGV